MSFSHSICWSTQDQTTVLTPLQEGKLPLQLSSRQWLLRSVLSQQRMNFLFFRNESCKPVQGLNTCLPLKTQKQWLVFHCENTFILENSKFQLNMKVSLLEEIIVSPFLLPLLMFQHYLVYHWGVKKGIYFSPVFSPSLSLENRIILTKRSYSSANTRGFDMATFVKAIHIMLSVCWTNKLISQTNCYCPSLEKDE